jgi:glycosyltransferase involved in cell wall biosynthesis
LFAIVTPRGPDEVVRDGVDGYLVPAGDPAAIIEALERLYADAEVRLVPRSSSRL